MPGAPGEPFFLLNFHQLCNDPVVTVAGLANFIEVDSYSGNITELIKAPGSVGRYKEPDCSCFDASDYRAVRDLGFDVQVDI